MRTGKDKKHERYYLGDSVIDTASTPTLSQIRARTVSGGPSIRERPTATQSLQAQLEEERARREHLEASLAQQAQAKVQAQVHVQMQAQTQEMFSYFQAQFAAMGHPLPQPLPTWAPRPPNSSPPMPGSAESNVEVGAVAGVHDVDLSADLFPSVFRIPDWSSLPCDLLIAFLRLLDAPSALAYSGVCAAWRAAAAAFAGVPLARTPWLFYWEPDWGYDEDHVEMRPLSATLRCLLGAGNASFPTAPFPRARTRSLSCCGASHGWIIASDERSNLVLYNPFAPPSAANFIPLPPITDFECIRPGYSSDGEGRITAYVHNEYQGWGPEALGGSFYQKAILSCAPSPTSSNGAAYTAAVIHCESRSLSFAKAGDTEWREAWTLGEEETIRVPHSFWEDGVYITTNSRAYDEYCDVVHHDGRFYTVTKHGTVESWDLSGTNIEPGREVIGRQLGYARDEIVFFGHLVSTPWGDLLQIRVLRARNLEKYPQGVRVRIGKIIPTGQ
ncbi:hypothetical protein EJB05_35498 [Eragrostis curvula]|uniref:KIB1-4 beta-propeller domain-containing protein n=1 Tax=Eragrostis curvula TaxID=38414 RepID=A0A5J9U702_9POAL|nr:hypothetical protein EJB05_35498 [Eragrostis curvula]